MNGNYINEEFVNEYKANWEETVNKQNADDKPYVKEKFSHENIVGVDKQEDTVNHPSHYISANGLEAIDFIQAFTDGLTGGEAFCIGNALKYLCRFKNKNHDDPTEDLKKAQWYINRVINMWDGDDLE